MKQPQPQPIGVCERNPYRLQYEGKPIVLLTSAEHYGAVVNRAFDYRVYLDRLMEYGLNYTRIYPGALFEPGGKFIEHNTLAPEPQDLLVPWVRAEQPGYALGGNQFDLEHWDEAFFERLLDFIEQARIRGVIVEICFFNCQYPDTWPICPLQAANNVQGVGVGDHLDFQTLREGPLVDAQKRYVAEIVRRTAACANVIYEICDEPTLLGTSSAEATRWIGELAQAIVDAEAHLPHRHLIAQQVELGVDFTENDRIGLITAQYIYHNEVRQVGGPEALDCYALRQKPIELNETAYFPIWYAGDAVAASRVEAWEFLVGGGAAFNQLNGFFTVPDPSGDTPENLAVLSQLKVLKEFLYGFDLETYQPEAHLLRRDLLGWGAHARAGGAPGAWAVYVHHSALKYGNVCYVVTPGAYREELALRLPEGCYEACWVEPATGAVLLTEKFNHGGGERTLVTPEHAVDMALKVCWCEEGK